MTLGNSGFRRWGLLFSSGNNFYELFRLGVACGR
jgi:hypothetical protein